MQYIGRMLFITLVPYRQTQRRQQLEGRGVRGTSQKTARTRQAEGLVYLALSQERAFGYGFWSFIFYFTYARSLLLIPRRGYDVMTGVKAHVKFDSEKEKKHPIWLQLDWIYDSISCLNVDGSVSSGGFLTPINLRSHLLCSSILTVTLPMD